MNVDYLFNKDVEVAKRLDHLYDTADEWLLGGEFERCDKMLQLFIEKYLNIDSLHIMVGFITITIPWKQQLKNREMFVNNVYERCKKWYGEDFANKLMKGF